MRGYKFFSILLVLGGLLNGCAGNDVVFSNRGFEEISKGNYSEAEKDLEEALLLNPNNPYALLNMGVVYHETGRLEKAREMYERVIALQPQEQASMSNMASFKGEQLVELAKRNLELLQSQETASTAPGEKPLPPSAPAAATPQATTPLEKEVPGRLPEMTGQGEKTGPPPGSFLQPAEDAELTIADGRYRVRDGDTLLSIAGREDVYGDPLKWPAIYRPNMDVLGEMRVSKRLLDAKLPNGIRLKYVTAEGASHRLKALGNKLWVVDVASARSLDEVVESTVLLIKSGYHVYLTKRCLADEEWIRLRVGFFQGPSEALAVGENLRSLLSLSKAPWILKINMEELQAYGGY